MIVNKTLIEIENMIKMKRSFILCTYYIDTYSNFYTAMLNKELKKVFIDIFYIGVEDFLKICNLNKRIFPIFCIFADGKIVWKKCGFISFSEISNEFTKKLVLFS
ncbi:MAG: hypothetical protein J6K18_05445 [Bacilli bacterium]|nr:hypothetical protein [Bacilli bacterium]